MALQHYLALTTKNLASSHEINYVAHGIQIEPLNYAKKGFYFTWFACQGKPLGEKCIF